MAITRPKKKSDDPAQHDLSVVHNDEKLVLWRHHQVSNRPARRPYVNMPMFITQAEAADRLGIARRTYLRMEKRERLIMSVEEIGKTSALLETITPTPGDLCFLARRRSGTLVKELCFELGISRPCFYARERDADPSLVALWEERGFRFPREEVRDGVG
jgi:hypothetical protein